GDIREDPETKDLIVKHANLNTGQVETKRISMVVLCAAVVPSKGTAELAEKLGIEVDHLGFFKSKDPIHELESTQDGIYLVGSCQSPDDISNTVAKALGAASLAASKAKPLDERERAATKISVPEIPVSPNDPPRIGVFLCHCGSNIGGYVDMQALLDETRSLPDVVYATTNLYTCSSDTQELIKEKIIEHGLNRIIVAACTPRTHEKLFQDTMAEVGLNPYLLSFVSIRELDSWVHMKNPIEATKKAIDLVRMGVSRVRLQEPLRPGKSSIEPQALVIGGGVAGMSAALIIASQGIKVHLVEKKDKLGGFLNNIPKINFEQVDTKKFLAMMIKRISDDKNIKVYLNSRVESVSGSIGKYNITLHDAKDDSKSELFVGTVIVATGMREGKIKGILKYGEDPRIITQQELEHILNDGTDLSGKNITFIHCAGSRRHGGELGVSYCSLYCCQVSVTNALVLHEKYPDANVYVLFRDIRLGTHEEQYYWHARRNINYIRFDGDQYPDIEVKGEDEPIAVRVFDLITQSKLLIPSDLVVLNMPMLPAEDNKELSELFKIPIDANGFFLEAHIKLRPLDFATDGIFLAGAAQGPKNVQESIAQGLGAGSRALTYMLKGEIETEPIIAEVDPHLCIGCLECEKVCAYGAIGLKQFGEKTVSEVNPSICKGCGTCAATCPAHAITIHHFDYEQIHSQVKEAVKSEETPKIVTFLCNWCSYAGADNAGVSRFQYQTPIRPIRVMCSGRVDPEFILRAFLEGADGVLVTGCHIGDCHYLEGNYSTRERLAFLKSVLPLIGINPKRLRLEWVSASEGRKFADIVNEFVETVKSLGPFGSEKSTKKETETQPVLNE
ncbi:MAG: hydrogenase iron-sulfur subunit, partial [Promethearchaeota archaeon]